MYRIDLTGRRALVAGVSDGNGFGFAIAKELAEAGATVCLAVWPPALGVFEKLLALGKLDEERRLSDGSLLEFETIVPMDAAFDRWQDVPEATRQDRRYQERGDISVQGAAQALSAAHGAPCLDFVVHSLANAPEIGRPLLETSRQGYLAALGTSAYSMVSMLQHFGPLMREGGAALSLTYLASQRVVAGYGGGMPSAKAALESDTRVLAHEAGRRWNLRVNTLSAGPVATRAATATGIIDKLKAESERLSPLRGALTTRQVAQAALFLCSPLASAITGQTLYVDNGYSVMAMAD